MSEKCRRDLVRTLSALAWLASTGTVGEAAQEAPESREARGSIREMQRLGADDGWVLTESALLFTRDGGATWSDLAPSQSLDGVSDAHFLDPEHAWLAGVASGSPDVLAVLDTSDGGGSWRRREVRESALPSGQVYARSQVHFSDPAHGWLLGQVATSAAFSLGELLRTRDGGATWELLPRPPAAGRFVFLDAQRGFMTGGPVSERLYRTLDGGRTWREMNLPILSAQGTLLYDLPAFHSATEGVLAVTLRDATPRLLSFRTRDGGRSWWRAAATVLPAGNYDEPVPVALLENGYPAAYAAQGSVTLVLEGLPRRLSLSPGAAGGAALPAASTPSVRALSLVDGGVGWALVTEGGCDAWECRQVTRLLALDGSSAAGAAVSDLLVRSQVLPEPEPDQPLAHGAAISFDKGFDKCAAATTAQMQIWKTSSPYKDANIYYGGSARACSQPNLGASWVLTVIGQGWRLIPTWVGPQAPCTGFGNRFSSDPPTARNQGLVQAEAAVNGASALGLGAGTPLYYDLELYAENDASCSAAVRAFVNAWSERLKERGYLAGVYGNARNAQADWRTGVIASPPDAVWLTPWVCASTATSCNWSPTVFGIPGLSDAYWANNQRIRQYWGGHDETYGGVTFNIDSDFSNAPVATGGAPPSCQAGVPSDRWRGEYFANRFLSGPPAMVRDDGAAGLGFDWSTGSPSPSCGIGVDNFSVRWTRTLGFAAGTYRFNTRTDDGVRLYIDGVLKIDRWVDRAAPPVPDSVDVTLGAGDHTLRLEYYENGGLASAELSWQLISNPCSASVPADRWRGEYWTNKELAGPPAVVRDDGAGPLDFDWSTGSPSPSCGIGADNFSARWTRTLGFAAGTYRFTITSDDGFRFYVDGAVRLERWIIQAPTTYAVDVTLGAGSHTLRMDYFENTGLAVARVSWQGLATPRPEFDAASSAAAETADLTWPHTVAGSNRLLLVGASIRGNVPVAAVTYAGRSLTRIRHDTFGTDVRSELWYLVAPPAGTQNVQVRLSSAQNVIAGATSWTNVDQASPLGNHAGADHGGLAGTTASVQVPSAADQVVVDVVATQAAAATVSAGPLQTVRWNRPGNHGNGAGSSEPGAASTTLSWTLPHAEFWAISAVALRPSPSSGGGDRIERRVVVLSYDPVNPGNPAQRLSDYLGTGDVFAHSGRIAEAIRAASGRMADYQIVETHRIDEFPIKRDGFRYTWEGYLACRADVADCHSPDDASYVPIVNGEDAGTDLCARIGAGEVDEVWIWGFGWFGFDEFAYKIPNDQPMFQPRPYNYWIYDGRKKDLPACGRTYFVMGYNHERQEGRGLHSFGHRMESALTASPPGEGLWHRCGSTEGASDWTDFTCIDLNGPGQAGCGDVHFPPNGTRDYDYANSTPVTSQCDDWFNYPNRTGATTTVSYATWGRAPWGSDEDGYLTWWMNHIPRKPGGTAVPNNWWHYVLCYDQPCPMSAW